MTDRYAVVGNPVAHSKSPLIHAAFAQSTAQLMHYERLLAPLGAFAETARTFACEGGGLGLNVTAPFKLEAFALARDKSARALEAEACNTLAWRGDRWYGDNTDGAGLVRDLAHNLRVPLAGRTLLVFGAGGAARGVLGPLLAQNPRQVVLANRTTAKAEELARRFAAQGDVIAKPLSALAGQRFDIVINATSPGHGDTSPNGGWVAQPAGMFHPDTLAYDLIYDDQPTPFLRWAQHHGVRRTVDGLGMLIEQAAESFLLWRGVRPDTAAVFSLLRVVGR